MNERRGQRRPARHTLGVPRSRTLSAVRVTEADRAEASEPPCYPPGALESRPRTRGDCADGERPCPWVSCRHHLYLDVDPYTGSIKLNFPHLEVDELPVTCSLDRADEGAVKLDAVAEILNVSRERVRQIEVVALRKLHSAARGEELRPVPRGELGRGFQRTRGELPRVRPTE